jgi:hypothetical protein
MTHNNYTKERTALLFVRTFTLAEPASKNI